MQPFESLPVGVYRTTPTGEIIYANAALAELLGYGSVDNLKQTKSTAFYLDVADRDTWRKIVEEKPTGYPSRHISKWRRSDGGIVLVENIGHAVKRNDAISYYEGIVTQIGEAPSEIGRITASKADFNHNEESLELVLEMLPVCISRKDSDGSIVWANEAFCHVENIDNSTLIYQKNTDTALYGPEKAAIYRESDKAAMESGELQVLKELHGFPDGTQRPVNVLKIPLFNTRDYRSEPVGVEVFFWETSTLAKLSRLSKLRRRGSRWKRWSRAFDLPSLPFYEHDLNGILLAVSPAAARLVGTSPEALRSQQITSIVAKEFHSLVRSKLEDKRQQSPPSMDVSTYELEILSADGRRIPVEVNSRLLIRHGSPYRVVGFLRDLTRQKEVENRRLREIHHRVKNNLFTISSMLARQADNIETAMLKDALHAAEARVIAISEFHEHLYRLKSLDRIDAGSFLLGLLDTLRKLYMRSWQDIIIRPTVNKNVMVSLDTLSLCAIVLNELISNAFKHAFPLGKSSETRHGVIFVHISQLEASRTGRPEFRMVVSDTGIGLPTGINLRKLNSLGWTLVFGLIEKQMRGSVQVGGSGSGTSVTVEFPV
jgi:PAS domain S-box-containing protein